MKIGELQRELLMTSRIDLTPIYVLHTRPFRNSSLLVDFFSRQYGRISAVARSARGPTSRYQGKLQLFTPILASWFGQHELKSLGNIELHGAPLQLNHQPLFCAFYLNELLIRVLHKEDPYPMLFDVYDEALKKLEQGNFIFETLRLFEKKLLAALGYALPLSHEAKYREAIQSDGYYSFDPAHGFFMQKNNSQSDLFLGADLIAIREEQLFAESVLKTAKRLMRLALNPLLGDKPIYSRGFFE